jgi:hypothetical protein
MDIDSFQFSKRDNKSFVTDAKAGEAIANIELSRRHALNPRPRTIAESGQRITPQPDAGAIAGCRPSRDPDFYVNFRKNESPPNDPLERFSA